MTRQSPAQFIAAERTLRQLADIIGVPCFGCGRTLRDEREISRYVYVEPSRLDRFHVEVWCRTCVDRG